MNDDEPLDAGSYLYGLFGRRILQARITTVTPSHALLAERRSRLMNKRSEGWLEREAQLCALAHRQIFFVGGAPRSGTTWLQILLDAHPEVSCRGEGLFRKHLAEPLDALVATRRRAIEEKNNAVFGGMPGYPIGEPSDADHLLGSAILLELSRQLDDKPIRAIGEKTPENVFFFPRLKAIFPKAKFIGIARDPRDLLTSAWHYFHRNSAGGDDEARKIAFIESAFPSLNRGTQELLSLPTRYPSDAMIVTYEAMKANAVDQAVRLFDFLGVSVDPTVVAACVERASFKSLSRGRSAGVPQSGMFFYNGVVGGWQSTLTPRMNNLIMSELGWMFPRFGWTP